MQVQCLHSRFSIQGLYGRVEVYNNKSSINSWDSALLLTLSNLLERKRKKSKYKYTLAIYGWIWVFRAIVTEDGFVCVVSRNKWNLSFACILRHSSPISEPLSHPYGKPFSKIWGRSNTKNSRRYNKRSKLLLFSNASNSVTKVSHVRQSSFSVKLQAFLQLKKDSITGRRPLYFLEHGNEVWKNLEEFFLQYWSRWEFQMILEEIEVQNWLKFA